MFGSFLHSGIYYLADGLVLGLLLFIVWRGLWQRLLAPSLYLLALLLIDGFARRYVLYHFGEKSLQWFYFYWLTDIVLALGAFLLICTFFQRACANEAKMWHFVRLFLVFVFILVLGISAFSLSRNYGNIYGQFMMEFQQDLYFTCLVLNTLVYILVQQLEAADDELSLLVSGMGLQFAGPAANLALVFLTGGQQYANALMTYLSPLCTLGMLITWFYTVVRMSKPVELSSSKKLAKVRTGMPILQLHRG